MFEHRQISNFLKINCAKFFIFIHLLKDFFVILAFNKTIGILFSFSLIKTLGQISESINNAIEGFQ